MGKKDGIALEVPRPQIAGILMIESIHSALPLPFPLPFPVTFHFTMHSLFFAAFASMVCERCAGHSNLISALLYSASLFSLPFNSSLFSSLLFSYLISHLISLFYLLFHLHSLHYFHIIVSAPSAHNPLTHLAVNSAKFR